MLSASPVPAQASCAIPAIGIGTYELRGEACTEAVCTALRIGYRLIDTGAAYRNEHLVGEGIRASGVPRSEIFINVKLIMRTRSDVAKAREEVLTSLSKLQLSYADCVLLHWPGCAGLKPADADGQQEARRTYWRALRGLQREGRVRHIGVSNFLLQHFNELRDVAAADGGGADRPSVGGAVVNQIELHPLCVQADVVAYCHAQGMRLQQYSPLAKGDARLLNNEALSHVQRSSFAQFSVCDVLIMWGLAQGYSTLVRSCNTDHLLANWRAAQAYFASNTESCSCTPLTAAQRNLICKLHEKVGCKEDVHFCWFSEHIA